MYLMVNLDDGADCRRAIQQLKSCVRGGRRPHGPGRGAGVADLPLGQKLRRIRQRGIWRHLRAMAALPDQPRSLMEWDQALGLPGNKMRSLKAIMAKLENRFAIRFLVVAGDGSHDEAGNPRYSIPPRVRSAILRLAEGDGQCHTRDFPG